MKDQKEMKKILSEMEKTYFTKNREGFFLKSCSRTQEFFLFSGKEKEEQREKIIAYFAKQKKTLNNNQVTLGGEYKSDTFCFTEPQGNFKKNNILAKDGFETRLAATQDINFVPSPDGDYTDKVQLFAEINSLAIRGGIFFSKDTYEPNVKLAFAEKLPDISGHQVFQIFDIAQKSPFIESRVNRTLKGLQIFALVRNLYEKLKKTKRVKTYVGDLKEPILDFGIYDIIFLDEEKTYHRFLEGYVVSSFDLTKQYLLMEKSEALDSKKYVIQIKGKDGTVKIDHSAILDHKTKIGSINPNNPTSYDEVINFVETRGFEHIISKKTPVTKVCGPLEYIEIKNLSAKYIEAFFQAYPNHSFLQIDKSTFHVFFYKKLPVVNIKDGKIDPEKEAENMKFRRDPKGSLVLNLDPKNKQLKYDDVDQLKELQLAVRGTDKKGKGILFDLENYVAQTQPSIYRCQEIPTKVNIMPYRIFYIDSVDALSMGVFDCIKPNNEEEIIILDATIYLNKNIVNSFRENTTNQKKKRIQFSNASLNTGLTLPTPSIPLPIPGIGGPIGTDKSIDIGSLSYNDHAIGTGFPEPLGSTETASILLLKFGSSRKTTSDLKPAFSRQNNVRNKSGVRRQPSTDDKKK